MSEPSGPAEDASRAERFLTSLKIAMELLGLALTIYYLWIMLIPEHSRKLMLMRAAETTRQRAGKAAFRAGHQAMGLEIRGRGKNYELPYRLSQARDLAGRAYDKLRSV